MRCLGALPVPQGFPCWVAAAAHPGQCQPFSPGCAPWPPLLGGPGNSAWLQRRLPPPSAGWPQGGPLPAQNGPVQTDLFLLRVSISTLAGCVCVLSHQLQETWSCWGQRPNVWPSRGASKTCTPRTSRQAPSLVLIRFLGPMFIQLNWALKPNLARPPPTSISFQRCSQILG